MRKLSFALSLLMLLSCFSFSAFAAENSDTVIWSDETSYTKTSGYPRMAQFADGTLIMTTDGSGTLFVSKDNGASWTYDSASKPAAFAATTVDLSKITVNSYTEGLLDTIRGYREASTTTSSETGHKLLRSNFQPFVCPDGTVLVAYRSNTSSYAGTYYSSIRVLTSTDGADTFGNEKILIESASTMSGEGYWEPFMIQIDESTIALYYADDFNVDDNLAIESDGSFKDARQRIAYFLYTVGENGDWSKGTWSENYGTAIYRTSLSTRDGMPMVTKLIDGTFAMVNEVHDNASWNSENNSVFTIGLALSKDGKTWTDPVAVAGPTDLSAGMYCAAPSITTLPDGRIVISYQTDEGYVGDYSNISTTDSGNANTYARIFGAVISTAPVTNSTTLTPTTGGAAAGFETFDNVFSSITNGYQIWNAVSCFGDDLYCYGTAGVVTGISESGTVTRSDANIRIHHAKVYSSADALASFNAATARSSEAAYEYAILSPNMGETTLTVETPHTLADAANIYVYALNGDYITLKGTAETGNSVTFDATETANYIITDKEIVTYGDSNKDGSVSIKDVIRMARYVVGTAEGTDVAASDMNGSLSITTEDILELARKLLTK